MRYWLLKTEPEEWSWQQQVKSGNKGAEWNGVRNFQAANNLKSMKIGDKCFFYLTGQIKSIVGIDLDSYAPYPVVDGKGSNGGYCGPAVKPIALHMLKDLKQHPAIKDIPISGIGGIENWRDVVEYILLGATSVQVCTAVMHYGFGIVREMESGLLKFMKDKGYNTIYDFAGKALPNVLEWKDLNLKYDVKASINKDKCIG